MKFAWGILCMVLFAALLGCVSGKSKLDTEQCLLGTWTSTNSVAVYEIAKIDGQIAVKGHSSYSGKELVIGDVSWDGKVLRFASYMPSTDIKVLHENRLLDATTMGSRTETSSRIGSETMGPSSHELIWKKQRSTE